MRGLLPSRRLARGWLNLAHADRVIEVAPGEAWLVELDQALASGSRVRLRFSDAARDSVGAALAARLAQRYDRSFSLGTFRIAALVHNADGWELLIQIDDMEMD